MEGILKVNEIPTLGGVTPQGDGVKITANFSGWVVVEVDDSAISSIQEFNIQPVSDGFSAAVNGPSSEGAYNQSEMTIRSFGDEMKFVNNPGQVIVGIEGVADGTPIEHPDDKDTISKKNFTSEDVAPYKEARRWIKKYDAKSVLRNQIRGKIVDVEDDIADTKVLTQFALYYFAHEWNTRTQDQKDSNPAKNSMDQLTSKLLSDDIKMRADLKDGLEVVKEIVEKEIEINKFVNENYKYNDGRGI